MVEISSWPWARNIGPKTTACPAVTSSDGVGDQELDERRLPKLTLHPLIWAAGLIMAFLAGIAGAVVAVWPQTCAWLTAGSVVLVLVVAAASRHWA